MRPQLRAFFDGDENQRHTRHAIARRKRVEPFWSVAIYSLRDDCEEGETDHWDGSDVFVLLGNDECPAGTIDGEAIDRQGRRIFKADFNKYWDALMFAKWLHAHPRRDEMHDVRNAQCVVIVDQNFKEFARFPFLKLVPAEPRRRSSWLWRMLGWN